MSQCDQAEKVFFFYIYVNGIFFSSILTFNGSGTTATSNGGAKYIVLFIDHNNFIMCR